MIQEGQAEYSEIAFQQDAAEAMKGDISRGLIELITNADDAYSGKEGSILIKLESGDEKYPIHVSVSDHAKGLDFEGLKNAFTKIGALTSLAAEGKVSRGYLGRGAKDVAIFGAVTFEAIKDGKYSAIILYKSGKWRELIKDQTATSGNYEALSLTQGENGLKATILCNSKDAVKNTSDLFRKLSTVSQLRDLNKRRKIVVQDLLKSNTETELTNPLPQGEEILKTQITLDGYEGEATLIVRKLHEIQSAQVSEYSAHGILVKSGVSIFQNTWFSQSLRNRPAARWLAGEVEVPQIGIELAAELRTRIETQEVSDLPLLSRTRDGLAKDHPLMKSLTAAVEKAVASIFDQIDSASNSGQKQGEKLTNDFNLAAAAVMPDLAELLKELEDEEPIYGGDSEPTNFDIIPSLVVVKPGALSTLTLRIVDELAQSQIKVKESSATKGLKLQGREFGKEYDGTWVDHVRLANRKTDQLGIVAPNAVGVYSVEIKIGSETRNAQILVSDKGKAKKPVPTGLEFSPKTVFSSPGRGKNMLLRAPLSFADVSISIASSGVNVVSVPNSVTLVPEPEGRWVEAVVHIKTGTDSGELQLTASSGLDLALGTLKVEEAGTAKGSAPKLTFELNGDKDPLDRYFLEKLGAASFVVFVYGKHPLFNNVFGNYTESANGFANEDSREARAILSEVIAHAFAQYLVELAYEKKPEDLWDAASTMFLFNSYFDKFVGKLNRALVR